MNDAVQADTLAAMPSAVRWIGGILFVLAVPLFLILGNVLDVANDRQFYATEFDKYDVGRVTGLSRDELATVADLFITYLSVSAPDIGEQRQRMGYRALLPASRQRPDSTGSSPFHHDVPTGRACYTSLD